MGHDDRDEQQLTERAAAGDAEAVEELLHRHLPGLRAYVRLRAGPLIRERESASDLVQSVCRDLLANLHTFRYPGEGAFRGWLFTAALRKISDRAQYWRRAKRDRAREVAVGAPNAADDTRLLDVYRASICSPSQAAMGREALTRVEDAFEQLREEQREVIVLSRIVGLSRAEVAERMGRSEASVRNLLSRGLAALAELLGPEEPSPP